MITADTITAVHRVSHQQVDNLADYRLRYQIMQMVEQARAWGAINRNYVLVTPKLYALLQRGHLPRASKGWRRHVRRQKAAKR